MRPQRMLWAMPAAVTLDRGPSYLKGHFITTLPKARLQYREPRMLSHAQMRQVAAIIRRGFDPDAPWEPQRVGH